MALAPRLSMSRALPASQALASNSTPGPWWRLLNTCVDMFHPQKRVGESPSFHPIVRRRAGLIALSAGLMVGQARKHAFHRIDSGEIALNIVIAAALTRRQSKTPPRIAVARPGAAQVDQGSHILLLLERSGRD